VPTVAVPKPLVAKERDYSVTTIKKLLARRFLLLTLGEAASLLGDQLTRIALVWLILELTESAMALGIWLSLSALPRVMFLLVGGALADRFSPRSVMITSNAIRAALLAILAIAAAANALTFFWLCVFTVVFGAAAGLYTPSLPAILPRIVPTALLQIGNSVVQAIMHLSNLVGPPFAALILASLLAGENAVPASSSGQQGYALLFAIDAASFLISLWTLHSIGGLPQREKGRQPGTMLAHILKGARYATNSSHLRVLLFVTVIANFGIGGPLAVAMPLLAKFALPQGVIALGLLSAAGATGSLAGLGVAALLRQQETRKMFLMPFVFLPALGLLMVSLGWAGSLERAALTLAVMTALAVYIDIQMLTWLQQVTAPEYLGRVISVVQLCAFGTLPVSMAIAGFLGTDLMLIFASFGITVIAATLLAGLSARKTLRQAHAT